MKYIIYIFISIVIVILAGGFYFWYQFYIPCPSKVVEEFLIAKGAGTREIAAALKEAGFIRSANGFTLYVWIRGMHRELQAGRYILSPSYDIKKIAEILTLGEVQQEIVKITIPEGFTDSQINKRLLEADFKKGVSISGLTIADFVRDYNFLTEVPQTSSLQGFLFPDTYFFSQEAKADEVVKKILDNFNQKVTLDLKKDIASQGRALYNILKMASLLEKEVKTEEDRKLVAGIFWQRLATGQPLESCATIAYILEQEKPRYSYEETRTSSPYNTYLCLGLPPTPINNPGLEAIKAAIYPQESPYNYFLTDPATGQTIFAKSIEEHNENKTKYFTP